MLKLVMMMMMMMMTMLDVKALKVTNVYLKIIYVHEQSASDDDVILRDVSEGF